jgi:hypothetical protein
MPTLFRFFAILLALVAIGAGAMVYLANFVSPQPREIVVRIPPAKLAAP